MKVYLSKMISCLMNMSKRGGWILSLSAACILGAFVTLLYFETPNLRLEPESSLLSGQMLLLLAIAIVTGVVLRHAFASKGGIAVLSPNRSWNKGVTAYSLSMLYAVIFGSLTTTLLLAAFNPVDNPRCYIEFDVTDNPNDSLFLEQRLKITLEIFRSEKAQSKDIVFNRKAKSNELIFVENSIAHIIQEADKTIPKNILEASPEMISDFAQRLDTEVRKLGDINPRLKGVRHDIGKRKYDSLYVISPSRDPLPSIDWPLDPSRVYCKWENISLDPAISATANLPRIVHVYYTFGAIVKSILEVDMEIPQQYKGKSLKRPVLKIQPYMNNRACGDLIEVIPPDRDTPWREVEGEAMTIFGVYEDLISYKVFLPRIGDEIELTLDWGSDEMDLPQFERRLAMPPRVVNAIWTDPAIDLIYKELFKESNPALVKDNMDSRLATYPKAVEIVVGPLASAPVKPTVEIIFVDNMTNILPEGELKRTNDYRSGAWWSAEEAKGLYFGLPSNSPNYPDETKSTVFVEARNGVDKNGALPILFQRDAIHNHVTLAIPPHDKWSVLGFSKDQCKTLRFLLLHASELAANGCARTSNINSTYFVSKVENAARIETEKPSPRVHIGKQLLQALISKDSHIQEDVPTNTINKDVLRWSMWQLALLIAYPVVLGGRRLLKKRENF